ncbi:MAG: efflux RND transporter permease subunit, partial [Limisphaerales bacterium]
RQIMVYVDPLKLEAYQLSVMDVVRAVDNANLILPAGDVKIGPYDYNLYVNSQVNDMKDLNQVPLKTVHNVPVLVGDVGKAEDASQIQYNVVRVDGQPSVYLPVLKQGGDANTISVVNGIKKAVSHLLDVPKQLVTKVVFDQSAFVKGAILNIVMIGVIGLLLTGVLLLFFFGTLRATFAVFVSIPISVLAAIIGLALGGSSINMMLLGGLALAFPRLIFNSVVVLEGIFRHLEMGETTATAVERGSNEASQPVLASTLATAVVFFPVIFLYGVSKYLFSALALSVVLSLAASYVVAVTVVPLFCAKFLKFRAKGGVTVGNPGGWLAQFNRWFESKFNQMLNRYERILKGVLKRPLITLAAIGGIFVLSLGLYPFIGEAYFPRTDPSQFVINLKAPAGTRIEDSDRLVQQVEHVVREVVPAKDLKIVVSNIGVAAGFSCIYTPNSGPHTAFVQVGLNAGHRLSSFQYMSLVRARLRKEVPEVTAYFQTGGLVDAIVNMGLPAPLDIQVSGINLDTLHRVATQIARAARALPDVGDALVPQDVDYPSLELGISRLRASELGLNEKEVVDNVITALTSDQMIAPSYWVDPKSGNDYFLTVQYPEDLLPKDFSELGAIPLRGPKMSKPTRLDNVAKISQRESPTEVDHYQLMRTMDVYVSPSGEDISKVLNGVRAIVKKMDLPKNVRVTIRGSAEAMQQSFRSFGLGLILSTVLVYLILVAQFKSFVDPLLILLAVPTGITGVLAILFLTGTTLNIMSLMGVVMVLGIVVSNSILIVEFTNRQREEGRSVSDAICLACRSQARPILVTSLATIVGLLPMAMKMGAGSEAYAPLARAIIGGLAVSVILTIFLVPAAYVALNAKRRPAAETPAVK